ncbi:MAG: DUF805 domain-containing protein [Candidatus Gastranaerophilales bacterium]|jgi:uncharacterized membrane protein YhaH (DUF805 family)|nr:DUF805 domain-containing protein [Candidatus Gastranaerophilales bacterium]
MDFPQAVQSAFRNYVNFQGRASRSEYWYFILFLLIGGIIVGIIDKASDSNTFRMLFDLATFLPSLSVAVRRMHDINRTGWWVLLPLTIIGIIPYIYFLVIKGTEGENRFGADPLAQ